MLGAVFKTVEAWRPRCSIRPSVRFSGSDCIFRSVNYCKWVTIIKNCNTRYLLNDYFCELLSDESDRIPTVGNPTRTALFVPAVEVPESFFTVIIFPVHFYLERRVTNSHFKCYSFAFIQHI